MEASWETEAKGSQIQGLPELQIKVSLTNGVRLSQNKKIIIKGAGGQGAGHLPSSLLMTSIPGTHKVEGENPSFLVTSHHSK